MKISKGYVRATVWMLALCVLAFAFQGCATTDRSMPTAERLVEMGIVTANDDLAALNRGRVTAIMDCRDCHRQYWPQEFAPKRWPRISRNMGEMASMKEQEIEELSRYLVEASKTVDIEILSSSGSAHDEGEASSH